MAALLIIVTTTARSTQLPAGYVGLDVTGPIMEKTIHVALAPDISRLSPAERQTVSLLIEAGEIFQHVYEKMRHRQALEGYLYLVALDRELGSPPETQNLKILYYAAKGPIFRGLDNQRFPLIPVDPPTPGGAVYPWGVTREEIDAFLAENPDSRESILHLRTVVRRAERTSLDVDLATLHAHRTVDDLHPGLREHLSSIKPARGAFYAVPYSVAYAPELTRASDLLVKASGVIEPEDADFAAYLRARARDLLTDDYEPGDSTWVSGRFKNLNAQIGSYETYDDHLYGVKTYFSLNVLLRDNERSDALRVATAGLQRLEDSLPYDDDKPHKRVRSDIPVGVYDIIADFAQSRGTNTATILPNEASAARKYGRTILLRRNIMTNSTLFGGQRAAFAAAVEPEFVDHLSADGGANRTLWHEIGHYLGVDRARDGRDLDLALEQAASVYEEMKADLVSLYVSAALEASGYYTKETRRDLFANGVRRVLLKSKPDRSQVYQTMQLMQMNYFLEKSAISFGSESGKLTIHYDVFPDVVASMLREVFEVQAAGDREKAEDFIARYTGWTDDVHGRLAAAMQEAEDFRYAYVTYQALESPTE
jgi:hypothetical protein